MLSRRDVIRGGGAAALLACARPSLAAQEPLAGLNPNVLDRALAALAEKRRFLRRTDVLAVADYTRPSRDERFFLVHPESGAVTSYHVAHGRGSDPHHSGYVDRFSMNMVRLPLPTAPMSPATSTRANMGARSA